MKGTTPPTNRKDILIRRIGISFLRYMQKYAQSQHRRHVEELAQRQQPSIITYTSRKPKNQVFSQTRFRKHLDNIEEPIRPAIEDYCHQFCDWLAEEMLQAGHLTVTTNEKGEATMKATIPLKESKRRLWLERKLAEWHGVIPHH